MRLNLLFLFVAISLSVLSKLLQGLYKSKFGDVVVVVAGVFFVLAVLFSVERFIVLGEEKPSDALFVAIFCCIAVMSFQLMMIFVVGYGQRVGLILLVPFVVSVGMLVYKWM